MNKKKAEYASYIFATMFLSLTRLQTAGDKVDQDISMKQWLLLAVIMNSKKRTLTALGKNLGCSRQNVKKLAQPLLRSGFLLMNRDEADARAVQLEPTDKCRKHLQKREKYEERFLELLFAEFDELELAQFQNLIRKHLKGVEKIEEEIESGQLVMDLNKEG